MVWLDSESGRWRQSSLPLVTRFLFIKLSWDSNRCSTLFTLKEQRECVKVVADERVKELSWSTGVGRLRYVEEEAGCRDKNEMRKRGGCQDRHLSVKHTSSVCEWITAMNVRLAIARLLVCRLGGVRGLLVAFFRRVGSVA